VIRNAYIAVGTDVKRDYFEDVSVEIILKWIFENVMKLWYKFFRLKICQNGRLLFIKQ
jgi:hypothetical protein